jgi:hypothetical protein
MRTDVWVVFDVMVLELLRSAAAPRWRDRRESGAIVLVPVRADHGSGLIPT